MMDPDRGSVRLKGIVTLASHTSKPWAMDRQQWKISASHCSRDGGVRCIALSGSPDSAGL
jgi:hypothetical protein